MYKPMSLAIISGLVAAIVVLLCPLPDIGTWDGELTERGPRLVDEWELDRRLDALSARTNAAIREREAVITELLEERVSLDRVRSEFRRRNDEIPVSWFSLRAAFPGCSDAQCVDLQIRNYLRARPLTPRQCAAHVRLVAELENLPQAEGEQP